MAAQPIPWKTETLNQLSTTVATALDQQATIDTSIRGRIKNRWIAYDSLPNWAVNGKLQPYV